MPLIDTDALNARIDKCVGIDCLGLEPVMAIRDVKALISVMPTIDAIPVEWLNEHRGSYGSLMDVCIGLLLMEWQPDL